MPARRRPGDRAMSLLWAAVALSFALWPLVVLLGFAAPIEGAEDLYRPYFAQANWWLYPFFFLALAPGLWLTWVPLLKVWQRLAETEVMRRNDGQEPDLDDVSAVQDAVRRRRYLAVAAALLLSVTVNVADRGAVAHVYFGPVSLSEQLRYACLELGPSSKWLFERLGPPQAVCAPKYGQGDGARFSDQPGIPPPVGEILFVALTTIQQFLIVLLAALAVFQILLHTAIFALFERLDVARKHGLYLALNSRSPLNEFGLEHWNHALNNFYWAACPAMLGVFLSRAAAPPENYLPGQVLLGIMVPVCLLAPMVVTIIVRQARLPDAWKQLQPRGPVPPEEYRRQQLWPLDRNWTSKLGIVLAFALGALAIGFEMSQFVRF